MNAEALKPGGTEAYLVVVEVTNAAGNNADRLLTPPYGGGLNFDA